MKTNIQFRKNFIWNILGTGLNAFTSLFYMIIITRINGINDAGIFTIAYATACILYMIGIYAGRVYQVTENDKSVNDKDYILNRVISCSIAFIGGGIFCFIKGYSLYKIIIFLVLGLYKVIESFSDVLYGILQKNELLEKVGKSYFVKSILCIISFLIIDLITKSLLISCISLVIIYIIITYFYDYKNAKKYMDKNDKINKNSVLKIFKSGFFTFAISFLGVYITNVQKYSIDNYLSNDLQAIFGYIIMPATVMGLLAQLIIHPFLNKIFNYFKNKEFTNIKKLLYKIILAIFIIGILFAIVGFLIGTNILGILYNIDLAPFKLDLLIILIGATLYTMANIITPILVTMRCTFIQFIIYIVIAIFEYLLSNFWVSQQGFNGAIYSYLVTMIVYFIVFYITAIIIIRKKIKNEEKIK
ncbi:MAG: hypothetical protein IKF97_00820 [Clostridia bacterium]|nr:hypothetical protein [Clostridia bacterium]